MKSVFILASLFAGSLFTFSACQPDNSTPQPVQTGVLYQTNFQQGKDGWQVGFTDYSTQNDDMRFDSAWVGLPQPLDSTRKSLMVSSMNRSDDVFMFITRKLTSLQPNTDYKLVFDVELASAYADNSFGVGGSPGGSVYLKAGATPTEPVKVLKDGFYSINIDKGNQIEGGRDAFTLGTIGTGEDTEGYKLITRNNADTPLTVRSNAQGELWVIVGTDSGHEGLTTLYYSTIKVTAK